MKDLKKVVQNLKDADNILILSHMYPDGDALGSAFSLGRALQKMGKKVCVQIADKIPQKFKFFENFLKFEDFNPKCIISVDLASNDLVHPYLKNYAENIDICIDHHISNSGFAKINFVNPKASATCEIVYQIVKELNLQFDEKILKGIYVGIATDTGCFKYSNTTDETHIIASEILKLGFNPSEINEKLFNIKSKTQIKLEKTLYKNLEYSCGGKCAITFLTLENLKKLGIPEEECDGIASLPIKIEGVCVGITLRQKSEKNYKVSVRTSGMSSAVSLASVFGGGGHIKAAGFNISGEIEEVKKKIIDVANKQLENL